MIIIRTQDKSRLLEASCIITGTGHVTKQKCLYEVVASGTEYIYLGEYKTKERALEVLNLIQNALFQGTKLDYITSGGVRHYRDKVFEMPQE